MPREMVDTKHRPAPRQRNMSLPLALRFPVAMLQEINAIAAEQPDEPDRSHVIRALVAQGLEARRGRAAARRGRAAGGAQ